MKETNLKFRRALLFPLYTYRKIISPIKKPSCVYVPTCSRYMEQSVIEKGFIKGTLTGLKRIVRCNPFSAGGYDPP